MTIALTTILTKDPDAILDYEIDWAAWLASGDSIDTATWTSAPTGIIADSPAPAVDGTKARVWLDGGTAGQTYQLTCHIETTQGREDDRTVKVKVKNR